MYGGVVFRLRALAPLGRGDHAARKGHAPQKRRLHFSEKRGAEEDVAAREQLRHGKGLLLVIHAKARVILSAHHIDIGVRDLLEQIGILNEGRGAVFVQIVDGGTRRYGKRPVGHPVDGEADQAVVFGRRSRVAHRAHRVGELFEHIVIPIARLDARIEIVDAVKPGNGALVLVHRVIVDVDHPCLTQHIDKIITRKQVIFVLVKGASADKIGVPAVGIVVKIIDVRLAKAVHARVFGVPKIAVRHRAGKPPQVVVINVGRDLGVSQHRVTHVLQHLDVGQITLDVVDLHVQRLFGACVAQKHLLGHLVGVCHVGSHRIDIRRRKITFLVLVDGNGKAHLRAAEIHALPAAVRSAAAAIRRTAAGGEPAHRHREDEKKAHDPFFHNRYSRKKR